jgi:MFS family permease
MMPLELFHARTFSGINLLTLLLYGALGGAFFFLPFLLIQARGYSATATGAVYLPFTLVLGVLSRWSGGLIDRFGARRPLIIGPTLTAAGFALLSMRTAPYPAVLLSMTVLGLGMAITVAPLTTAVLNAVPAHRTGVASGINNAVASVGGLLMIALLGTVALGVFDRSLERHLAQAPASPALAQAVESARGGFVIPAMPASLPPEEQQRARAVIATSLEDTVALVLWIAGALALASALISALTLAPGAALRAAVSPPTEDS